MLLMEDENTFLRSKHSHNLPAAAAQGEAAEAASVVVLLDILMQVDCASSLPGSDL